MWVSGGFDLTGAKMLNHGTRELKLPWWPTLRLIFLRIYAWGLNNVAIVTKHTMLFIRNIGAAFSIQSLFVAFCFVNNAFFSPPKNSWILTRFISDGNFVALQAWKRERVRGWEGGGMSVNTSLNPVYKQHSSFKCYDTNNGLLKPYLSSTLRLIFNDQIKSLRSCQFADTS